jgi:hypothetical protein
MRQQSDAALNPSPPAQTPKTVQGAVPDKPAAPRTVTDNKPKKSILQSLLDFFTGMRKQEAEKPDRSEKQPAATEPAKTAQPAVQKAEPAKIEPVQPAAKPKEPEKNEPAKNTPAQPVAPAKSSEPEGAIAAELPKTGQAKTEPAKDKPVQPVAAAKPAEQEKKFPFWILLFVVLSLGAIAGTVCLVYVIWRKLQTIPGRSVSYVSGRTVASPPRRDMPVKINANFMLYLEVDDQSLNIGRRNTHSLKAGSTYTVGGGKSDFLIFLVPLPPSIGILRFDGKECTFIPKKARYFPEISGVSVPDCIEKTIKVISDSGYELSFRFKQYEDPLIALNRMMVTFH